MDIQSGSTAVLAVGLFVVILLLTILVLMRKLSSLRHERNELLNQKDVVFSFVYDVGEVFAGAETVEVHELLKRVLSYALRTGRAGAGALYLVEPGGETLRAEAVAGIFPPIVGGVDDGIETAFSKVRYVEELVRNQVVRVGEGLLGEVLARGGPIVIEEAETDTRVPRFRQDFLTIHSILLVPLRFRQEIIGVMAVVNRIDGRPFTASDASLLQALADQAAVSIHYATVSLALDEKRRMDRDLDLARQIQMALLPKEVPQVEGYELAAFSLPAEQVGGDYYDFVQVDGDHLGIAVADVSGKSVSGAIVMSVCRSILRLEARGCLSPGVVLKAVNRAMSGDMSEDMFVSMVYMIVNLRTREVTVARAGHMEPMIHSGHGGGVRVVASKGMAIGLADPDTFEAALEEGAARLQEGDYLTVYTDGVTEAQDRKGQEWGLHSLAEAVGAVALERGSASEAADQVRQRLLQFTVDLPQHDDMTMVVLKVKPEGRAGG